MAISMKEDQLNQCIYWITSFLYFIHYIFMPFPPMVTIVGFFVQYCHFQYYVINGNSSCVCRDHTKKCLIEQNCSIEVASSKSSVIDITWMPTPFSVSPITTSASGYIETSSHPQIRRQRSTDSFDHKMGFNTLFLFCFLNFYFTAPGNPLGCALPAT